MKAVRRAGVVGMNSSVLQDMNYTQKACIPLPFKINSSGLWHWRDWLQHSIPVVQLEMALIFVITRASHFILKQLSLPRIVSQMFTGFVLNIISLWKPFKTFRDMVFSYGSEEFLGVLATLSYIIFMFLAGVKVNVCMIKRTGGKAFALGAFSFLAPLIVGMFALNLVAAEWKTTDYRKLHFVLMTHSFTTFPVVVSMLSELKIINSELGRLGLNSAMVSDMFGILALTSFSVVHVWQEISPFKAREDIAATSFYVAVVGFIFRPAMNWVVRNTQEGRPVNEIVINLIVLMVLISGLLSNRYHQFFFVWPYILGLAVPDGPPLGSDLVEKLDCFVSDIFMPIFVTTCAMRTNFSKINFENKLVIVSTIVAVVPSVVKVIASLLPPLSWKMPLKDALALALMMCGKGVSEIATLAFLRDRRDITRETYTLSTLGVLIFSSIVPHLVKKLYDPTKKYAGYQKRNIMHLKTNAQLQVVACIHRPDNIVSIINLLGISYPNKESPVVVDVLHLVELIGRAAPQFISHQMHKTIMSDITYSENIIYSFRNFEKDHKGFVSVYAYTAISPATLMHEDICTLALDKLASLIILPFHKKWSVDGSVEAESHAVRMLNCNVLERSPCSVGILIQRGRLGRQACMDTKPETKVNVGIIFIGGKDDREALIYCMRMAKDPKVKLTVVHISPAEKSEIKNWATETLDSEVLRAAKENTKDLIYMSEVVKDGSETALICRSMLNEYDLIIVGRQHGMDSLVTNGMSEWSGFPELGPIGDILASEIYSKASVLVVQQQNSVIA